MLWTSCGATPWLWTTAPTAHRRPLGLGTTVDDRARPRAAATCDDAPSSTIHSPYYHDD
jgi:hypothetical protein